MDKPSLHIPMGYQVECLFTYSTASVRDRIIEMKNAYSMMHELVDKYFTNAMDNKITLVLFNAELNTRMYIGSWDGTLAIGTSVYMMNDPEKPGNNYMKLLPNK